MTHTTFPKIIAGVSAALCFALPQVAVSEPMHGIAMYGEPDLPPDFVFVPTSNPDAPKGGRIIIGENGGFDAFQPYIRKGRSPWGIRAHVYETLMARSYDEPFTLYGLLAESIETGPNREWVEFTLREEARFSDGSPVTVEDVIWSFKTLGEQGVPRYRGTWNKISTVEKTGPRSVKFGFNVEDRELALIMGLRPILRKADWDNDRDFEESSLTAPVGSGAYVVDDFEANTFISFKRNPDYWGKDLPFNKGRFNLDEIRYEYFADSTVVFEAFTSGEIDTFREGNAEKWNNYDFPALTSGGIIQEEFKHQRPSGMRGFVFNTRRDRFKDWRVRDALIHAFNFEFINKAINNGELPRAASYFSGSKLGMQPGPASGKVLALLTPYADELLPGALEGYALPASQGTERNRGNLRFAREQLQAAGWYVKDGVLQNEGGDIFKFEIVMSAASTEAIANLYSDALERLGIEVVLTSVDNAQMKERRDSYDYDMMYNSWALSLSPGNEQNLYWGSEGVETPGMRNYMGMNSPAAEAMIDEILSASTQDGFVDATRALDRILTTGRYVVPIWYLDVSRMAHNSHLKHPGRLQIYGDWLGFLPDVWWWED